ncbi:MAG: arylsulfatase A-like enzyme [Planctomycetota bacterium]|jgi:arylsulfatase A-like enzyme
MRGSLGNLPKGMTPARVAWGGFLALLSAGSFLSCGGAKDPVAVDGPNVLLISLDSTRRDLLSVYGHEAIHAPGTPTSPELDRLASEGVLFEEAYSTTSWTLPSHWSLMTGEPELVHAVDLDHHRPSPGLVPIAESLSKAGYRTAGFFTGPYLEPQFGFDRGFDRYEACYGEALTSASERAAEMRRRMDAAIGTGDRNRVTQARGQQVAAETALQRESHGDVSTDVVVGRVIEELERGATAEQPFFVFAHLFDPHFDHVAPEPYGSRFDPDFEGASPGLWDDFMQNQALSVPNPSGDFGERTQVVDQRGLENIWAGYEGELAWTDAGVGRILARLEELGLAEDTLVIVVADHGDEFFEHRGLGHRRTLYEEVVAVPMMMRLPGVLPAGARVPGTASLVQVVPTILDVLGLGRERDASRPWGSLLARMRASTNEAEGSAEEVPGEPVLGRFVQLVPAALTLRGEDGQATAQVEVRQVRLLETWRDGDLKILRRVLWIEAVAGATPAQSAQVRATRGREVRQEELLWIDLVEHPGEPIERYSRDFSDPGADAAFRRYQNAYGRLLARRGQAEVQTNDGMRSQLNGLGYTDSASSTAGDAFGSEALTLPVPVLP